MRERFSRATPFGVCSPRGALVQTLTGMDPSACLAVGGLPQMIPMMGMAQAGVHPQVQQQQHALLLQQQQQQVQLHQQQVQQVYRQLAGGDR